MLIFGVQTLFHIFICIHVIVKDLYTHVYSVSKVKTVVMLHNVMLFKHKFCYHVDTINVRYPNVPVVVCGDSGWERFHVLTQVLETWELHQGLTYLISLFVCRYVFSFVQLMLYIILFVLYGVLLCTECVHTAPVISFLVHLFLFYLTFG